MKIRRILAAFVVLPWLLFGAFYTGTATIATSGTAVQMSAAVPAPPTSCISFTVQVGANNSGTVYIGGSNVSAANKLGIALPSGQNPPASAAFLPATNNALYAPQAIYVDSTVNGDKVNYACYK